MPRHHQGKHRKHEIRMMSVIITAISLGLLAGYIVTFNGKAFGFFADADAFTLQTSNGDLVPSGLTGPAGQKNLWGPDVSTYLPSASWRQFYGAGARFAFVEVGGEEPGYSWSNNYYGKDMADAAKAHLYGMSYFYVDPDNNAADEASYAVGLMGQESSPLSLDFESNKHAPYCYSYGKSPSGLAHWIRELLRDVQKLTHQPPIIYAGQGWWNECVNGDTPPSVSFSNYQLWVANYRNQAPPAMPSGVAAKWSFWQWDQEVVVPGTGSTKADMNVLNPQTTVLTNPSSQSDAVGASVNLKLSSLNALVGYSLTYITKNLPPGLSVNTENNAITGTITGSPRVKDPYQVTITATNPYGGADSVTFSWKVTPGKAKPRPTTTPSSSAKPSVSATPANSPTASPSPTSSSPSTTPPTGSTTSPTPTSTPPMTGSPTPSPSISDSQPGN
jgi:GH25 family lysozyme M1 (1,4-beta-N-acetylmuramidase)